MIVRIDTREQGQKGLTTKRKERAYEYYTSKSCECIIQQLDTADYVFADTVAFEYKSIEDFMSSTYNGRLFDEITNQSQAYPYTYLVIVGELEDYILLSWKQHRVRKQHHDFNRFVKSTYAAYEGSTRRVRTVCPILYTISEKAAFEEMLLQAQKCLDTKVYGSQVKRKAVAESPVDVVLCSTKNISQKKAQTIKETLGITNLTDLLECSVENFKGVKGIGEKTAQNLHQFIHKGESKNDKPHTH